MIDVGRGCRSRSGRGAIAEVVMGAIAEVVMGAMDVGVLRGGIGGKVMDNI